MNLKEFQIQFSLPDKRIDIIHIKDNKRVASLYIISSPDIQKIIEIAKTNINRLRLSFDFNTGTFDIIDMENGSLGRGKIELDILYLVFLWLRR